MTLLRQCLTLALVIGAGLLISCQEPDDSEAPTPTLRARAQLEPIWERRKGDLEGTFQRLEEAKAQLGHRGAAMAEVYQQALIKVYGAPGDVHQARAQLVKIAEDVTTPPCVAARAAYYRGYEAPDEDITGPQLLALVSKVLDRFPECVDDELQGKLLIKKGNLLRDVSKPLEARAAYLKARGLSKGDADNKLRFDADFRLAGLSHDLGDTLNARRAYRDLMTRATAFGSPHHIAAMESRLGSLAQDSGELDKAARHFQSAISAYESRNKNDDAAIQAFSLAGVFIEREEPGDLEDARSLLEGGKGLLSKDSLPRHKAYHRWLWAKLHIQEGQADLAIQALEGLLTEALVAEQRWRTLFSLSKAYRLKGDLGQERRVLWEAISLVEAEREHTAIAFPLLAHKSQREQLYLRWMECLLMAWEDRGRLPGRGEPGGFDAEVTFVKEAVTADTLLAAADRIAADTYALSLWTQRGGMASALTTNSLNLEALRNWPSGPELRQAIEPGEIVVLLMPLADGILGLRVEAEGVRGVVIPTPLASLEEAITEALGALSTPSKAVPPLLDELGTSLLGQLLDPPQDGDRPLGVVPLGSLAKLPPRGLRLKGRFLVESYTPYELPSIASLNWLARQPPGAPTSTLAVAVGGNLAFAQADVSPLITPDSRPRLLAGADATPEAVLNAIPGYNHLHFAAHGTPPSTEKELGQIALHKGSLDLAKGPSLKGAFVVLAACQSRVGRTEAFEHGYGAIHRSLLLAGARSVVAARWDVDDEATSRLMNALYSQDFGGIGPARALALAQRQMIASDETISRVSARRPHIVEATTQPIPIAAPYSWAAFGLVGRRL